MAHLQTTTHTPSPHTDRQRGVVVKQICCFTATAVRAITMSLPQPAKKRNPGAWYSESRESVCVRVFDNERKINRKQGKELKTVNVYESVTE